MSLQTRLLQRRRWLVNGARGIAAGVCLSNFGLVSAHTPYNQWRVYRKKHLLIGCHRQDLATYDLAQQLVATIQTHLPSAKARVARAPHPERLASLLGTDQLQFAVLKTQQASEMMDGIGRFIPYGRIPLSVVQPLGDYLLLARDDVPSRHAWLLADALNDTTAQPHPQDSDAPNVAIDAIDAIEKNEAFKLHKGVTAYVNGQPIPE